MVNDSELYSSLPVTSLDQQKVLMLLVLLEHIQLFRSSGSAGSAWEHKAIFADAARRPHLPPGPLPPANSGTYQCLAIARTSKWLSLAQGMSIPGITRFMGWRPMHVLQLFLSFGGILAALRLKKTPGLTNFTVSLKAMRCSFALSSVSGRPLDIRERG